MKHSYMIGTKALSLITALSLVVLMSGMAFAAATSSSVKDENKLTLGITMLNSHAKLPSGEKVLTKQFTDEFGVKQDKISSLKGKNLTYGDIAVVLALADKMGGVTDTNISKIIGMKPSSSSGWAKVAKNLNLDIAEVADKVSTLEDHAHSGIKEAALESAAGRGAGGSMDSSGAGGSMGETESGVTGDETLGDETMGGTSGEGAGGGTLDPSESPSGSSGGGY